MARKHADAMRAFAPSMTNSCRARGERGRGGQRRARFDLFMTAANAPEDTHLDVRSIDRRVLSAHPNKAGIDLALLKIGGAEDC